jgi:hypothetical protein
VSQLAGPLAEFLADRIPKAAAKAHRRFPAVPAEDFEQAMWVKVLSRPDKFTRLLDDGKHGIIWAELRREATKVGEEDDRYRKAAAAAAAGYSVYDIEFYSTRLLAQLLPALIEADFDVSVAIERAASSTDAAGVHIRTNDPFGGAEEYTVILIDAAIAFSRLSEGTQRLLKTYYRVNQTDTQDGRWEREKLASSMGITADALRSQVHRALQRMQGELGGADPWLKRGLT